MARKKKFKVWWAFGLIGLALLLLALGRLTSKTIEDSPLITNVQVDSETFQINSANSSE